MIQLSSSAILVLQPDATTEPLDTEEIQTRIIRACIAAGETDSWIAGDLALAVEFALLNAEKHMVRAGELDRMIAGTLEDSGYPRVAAEFKRAGGSAPPDFLAADQGVIRSVLETNVAVEPNRLDRISGRVAKALGLIGLEKASRGLIIELARQFRDTDFNAPALPRPETHPPAKGEAILMRREDFAELVSAETASLLRARVLEVYHVSRLFSALRIGISLSAFAELNGLSRPVTELAFWSVSGGLAKAIDELCEVADKFCSEHGEAGCAPLPLCVSIRDAAAFPPAYMNCPCGVALECTRGLVGTFLASLKRQPFKVSLRES